MMRSRGKLVGALVLMLSCASAFAVMDVNGTIGAGEWDGAMWADPINPNYTAEGIGIFNLTEYYNDQGGHAELKNWGAKVDSGRFYALVNLAPEAVKTFADYNLVPAPGNASKQAKIFNNFQIDFDPGKGTGKPQSDYGVTFPHPYEEFDLALEYGVDFANGLDDFNAINAWGNGTDVRDSAVGDWKLLSYLTNATEQRARTDHVLEFSVTKADIIAAAGLIASETPDTTGDYWMIGLRLDSTLRYTTGTYTADVVVPKLIAVNDVNGDGAINDGDLLLGDADLDGDVDAADLATWGYNYTGEGSVGKNWLNGDFDQDGDVDAADLATWGYNYTGSGSAASMMSAAYAAAVPEPMTMSLLGLGGLAIVRRRRK